MEKIKVNQLEGKNKIEIVASYKIIYGKCLLVMLVLLELMLPMLFFSLPREPEATRLLFFLSEFFFVKEGKCSIGRSLSFDFSIWAKKLYGFTLFELCILEFFSSAKKSDGFFLVLTDGIALRFWGRGEVAGEGGGLEVGGWKEAEEGWRLIDEERGTFNLEEIGNEEVDGKGREEGGIEGTEEVEEEGGGGGPEGREVCGAEG